MALKTRFPCLEVRSTQVLNSWLMWVWAHYTFDFNFSHFSSCNTNYQTETAYSEGSISGMKNPFSASKNAAWLAWNCLNPSWVCLISSAFQWHQGSGNVVFGMLKRDSWGLKRWQKGCWEQPPRRPFLQAQLTCCSVLPVSQIKCHPRSSPKLQTCKYSVFWDVSKFLYYFLSPGNHSFTVSETLTQILL